ncbi:hypothetical protein FF38_09215, partial [Lucilia cuprina]
MAEFVEIECSFLTARRKVQRVGNAYLNAKKKFHSEHIERSESEEKLFADEFVVDINYLKSLDPKEWKDQDHYAVLGLGKLRFEATDDDIRRAYRKMVLQHHPDKRKAKGEDVKTDDDYFTCITKAYETLGTPKTRRSFDSVDPEFDDSFPTQADIDNNFYKSFQKYFNLNSRWSEKKGVPSFGDENSVREDVERFYSFWYDFKSWREFSYLDEEDKEKGQDRDERRWIEKENKAARIKRKKEEMMRIRALVDLAYNNDKRIQKFKNEEKERKLAAKRAKMDAVQAQKAEHERAIREAQLAKERAEKAEQKRIEQIRIEKEQMKKALKKERKLLRDKAKESKYFGNNDKDVLKNMEGVEKICETFNISELQELNKKMVEKSARDSFFAALKQADLKIKADLDEINQLQNKNRTGPVKTENIVKEVKKAELWSNENVQLLIKAVNLFPAGTSQRWDVIASFINQHSSGNSNVSARDVLNKAKALQNSDFSKSSLKTQANASAYESFEKSKKDVVVSSDITVNSEVTSTDSNSDTKENQTNGNNISNCSKSTTPGNANSMKSSKSSSAATTKTWTKEEQALLEQAIKTYPISTPDRWDRIAECIPNRTKKDCLRRVKELVELVNSKKEAQQAIPKYFAPLDKPSSTPSNFGNLKLSTLYLLVNSTSSVLQGLTRSPLSFAHSKSSPSAVSNMSLIDSPLSRKSLLVSEIAKAREHIKNSLEKMDGISCVDATIVPSNLLERIQLLEEENANLKQIISKLNDLSIDSQKRITALEGLVTCSKPVAQSLTEDDDGVDLFASDSDEESEEAARIREERLAAYAAKKSKKPVLIAKSSLVLDVKPWDDETDLQEMENLIRKISADGLLWGASKLVPVAFGISKLSISCVVEDDKVSIDWLTEEIEKNEEFVQSVDVAAFNKI